MTYDPRDDVKMKEFDEFSIKIRHKIFDILDINPGDDITENQIKEVENILYNSLESVFLKTIQQIKTKLT
jgi:hypothetical protein